MRRLGSLMTLVACCLLPGAASAATISATDDRNGVVFRSGSEDSDMLISWPSAAGFEIPYAGGVLTAGHGCVAGPPVLCEAWPAANWDIRLGAGDDRSKGLGAFGGTETVDGGSGDDEIYANGQRNFVTSGAGNDVGIVNSNSRATLDGNSGDDRLAATDQGSVMVDGGSGDDIVVGNVRGGNDLSGSSGDDIIVSTRDGGKFFSGGTADGGAGDDVISVPANSTYGEHTWALNGGTGADTIFGSPGVDAVSGGAGNDTVDVSGNGPADRVSCESGRDVVYADADDVIAANCELVLGGPLDTAGPVAEALAAADAFIAQLNHLNVGAFGPLLGD
jgi:Ca2+-binding RTX toxin-like protein